jgi:hypothetical protein
VWDLGNVLDPIPGEIEFAAEVFYDTGSVQSCTFKVEIGVRTDDVIVVGWISPTLAALTSTIGVDPQLLTVMPPNGVVTSSFGCNEQVGLLSGGALTVGIGGPLFGGADRDYVLSWLFHYGQDNFSPSFGPPPADFQSNGVIGYAKVDAYRASVTRYKFIAHLQIKYVKASDNDTFAVPPTVLHEQIDVGSTKNPCGPIMGALDVIAAQTGPATTLNASVTSNRVTLIADASPDVKAVRAFDALTAAGVVDWEVWENVGCRIIFRANGDTSPELTFQPFPSFYLYKNGALDTITFQVPIKDHFYGPGDTNYPVYPFGQESWSGAAQVPIPDSRCGDAESQPATSARTPEYTIP